LIGGKGSQARLFVTSAPVLDLTWAGGKAGTVDIIYKPDSAAALSGLTLYYQVAEKAQQRPPSPATQTIYAGGGGGYTAVWLYDPDQENLATALWLASAGGGGGGTAGSGVNVSGAIGRDGCDNLAITTSLADQLISNDNAGVGEGGITPYPGTVSFGAPGTPNATGNGGSNYEALAVSCAGAGGGGGYGKAPGLGGSGLAGNPLLAGSSGGAPGGGGGGGAGSAALQIGYAPAGGGGGGYQGGKGGDNSDASLPTGDRQSEGGYCQFLDGVPFSVQQYNYDNTDEDPALEISVEYNGDP
jgi:hypothetical protein